MNLKINLIIWFCLSVLISNGQYEKLVRGQKVNFDTAVAIRIDVYRAESKKLKLGSQVVDSLSLALQNSLETTKLSSTLIESLEYSNQLENVRIKEKDSLANVYYKNFLASNNIVIEMSKNKPKPWIENPKSWGLIGVVITLILIR